jgi:hypothetical protein
MPGHRRISGRSPCLPVRATRPLPPAQMSQTQTGVAAGVHATRNLAGGRAEDRITNGGHQHIDPKLRTHHRIQALDQGQQPRRGDRLDAYRGSS